MRIVALLLLIISCGRVDSGNSYEGPSNLLKNWSGIYERPSFSSAKMNQSESAFKYLTCNGAYPDYHSLNQPYFNYNENYYNPNNKDPYGVYDPYYNPNYTQNTTAYFPNNNSYHNNYGSGYHAPSVNNQINQNRYTGVASAPRGQMIIRSNNENEGSISFGELPYVGASNYNCQLFSNQTVDYEVSGNRLLICLQSPNENICFDYAEM